MIADFRRRLSTPSLPGLPLRLLLGAFLVGSLLVGCQPKMTSWSSSSTTSSVSTITVCRVDEKYFELAMASLGDAKILAATGGQRSSRPEIMVKPEELEKAEIALASDSKKHGYKLYDFTGEKGTPK